MSIQFEIYCTCFANGHFDLTTVPYQAFLRKDDQGHYRYADHLIGQQEDAEQIYATIEDWQASICTHDFPMHEASIRLPDELGFLKEEWAHILPKDQYKNLISAFSRSLDFEFRGSVVEETLAEIVKLKQATFHVARLLRTWDEQQNFVAITGIDQVNLLNSLFEYSSYLSHEGFNILKVSCFELLDAEMKLGLSLEDYLAGSSSSLVFNANRFTLTKQDDQFHYVNVNSGQYLTTPNNMTDGFNYFRDGIFEVKYEHYFKLTDTFEILPQMEKIFRKALELDGWIEAW